MRGRIYIGSMRLPTLALLFLALAAGLPATAAGEEDYYIGARDGADLFSQPRASAEKLAHLPRKTDVNVLEKRRGWWKVERIGVTPEQAGWVYESVVNKRYSSAVNGNDGGTSFLSGFSSLFRTEPKQDKTAVLGVRGLDEENGATAQADAKAKEAVSWMDSLAVNNADLDAFIEEGDLNP